MVRGVVGLVVIAAVAWIYWVTYYKMKQKRDNKKETTKMIVIDKFYELIYNHTESEVYDKVKALVQHLEYSIEDINSFDELTPKEQEVLEPIKEFLI